MTRKIRMIIEYDGTDYVGWQTQSNGISIQSLLEKAILDTTGEKITVHGSGRTDSGVHARAQVGHFETESKIAADKFSYALNTRLPEDIRVQYSEEAPDDFHSRFSAKKKEYCYTVQLGPHAHVFTARTSLHIYTKPNLDLMNQAARQLLGEHDFKGFMSTGTTIENTVRSIYRSEWIQEGTLLRYYVCGNGFLYNMVRILVGTMLSIGNGHLPADTILKTLSSCQRTDAGDTAPAHGLTLNRVMYEDFDTEEILKNL